MSRDNEFPASAGPTAANNMPAENAPKIVEGKRPLVSEDWLAIIFGLGILAVVLGGFVFGLAESAALKEWIGKPGKWKDDPISSVASWQKMVGSLGIIAVIATTAASVFGRMRAGFLPGLVGVLLLATLAYVLSAQETINNLSLEYALWALVLGLIVSNTVGTPAWLRSAAMTEFYIKTGLVIYGAEILFGQLLALGLPGICVAWIVTPIVLITTFWFGQKVLKIESASLNMVVSADMSVCGVSAAIATAAACKAKKEELSLAISMSLGFTVIMMVVLPRVILWLDLPDNVGGAWLGGTIDSTGAVAAAGAQLSENATAVAITIKMIQNILIGVVAFAVAWYWVRFQEPKSESSGLNAGDDSVVAGRGVGIGEVWRRFPRFILGFLAASIFFSTLARSDAGMELSEATVGITKTFRGWFFCMAFVSIGLETNFLQFARVMKDGKPLLLYVCGQTLNLVLTLAMAWVVFELVFPGVLPTQP